MSKSSSKPLMRSLGEFIGHIIKGVKSNPAKTVVRKTVQEAEHGELVLRRTTIDEIERKPQ